MRIIGKRRGFSLVELMIVIALIGILSSIAIPSWNRYRQNADLKTAARGIAGDVFNMKQRAVSEQTRYRIIFDLANHRYQLIKGSTGNDVIQTRDLSEYGPGITLTKTTFTNDTVNFFTRGTTDWGTVSLKNSRESTATVTLNPVGRTHVSFKMQ
ncbi:MAG TPA: prepilin-type N-terminal cleavage/methylation domain-containing protein [Syntrophales bacterium]|nr:prepilin-type N-terminal cleavage/methylation domain-containing protein [Syntrophales bacterium]HPX56389.1 prepilin-type N-terminal cleavage/methylation domain-containing protein [Syntrophales bacterium]HQA83237.1 prepilin-type N-terminal cleavage/methylation domain-containing protein [Syntrophales bacterium]